MCEQLQKELMEITGAKQYKFVATRLKWANLLPACNRCGGGGNYSYCQMYGTTCFGCSGSGVRVPKLTQKWVAEVREKFTPEIKAEYLAYVAARDAAKKRVAGYKELIENTPLDVEYRRLSELAKAEGGCKSWMDTGDWIEANYPHIYYAAIGHYAAADRTRYATSALTIAKNAVTKVLNGINPHKPVDWLAIDEELVPLICTVMLAGQIPATDSWKAEWRVWGKR